MCRIRGPREGACKYACVYTLINYVCVYMYVSVCAYRIRVEIRCVNVCRMKAQGEGYVYVCMYVCACVYVMYTCAHVCRHIVSVHP